MPDMTPGFICSCTWTEFRFPRSRQYTDVEIHRQHNAACMVHRKYTSRTSTVDCIIYSDWNTK